ncbi:hypothetical protein NL676_009268 [Syzygium grande]|nr:hypothetical protein NL676_009268 [Syzygium grande]
MLGGLRSWERPRADLHEKGQIIRCWYTYPKALKRVFSGKGWHGWTPQLKCRSRVEKLVIASAAVEERKVYRHLGSAAPGRTFSW